MAQSGFEKFKFDRAGYKQILRSDGVESDLQVRANKVKGAVEAQLDDPDIEIIADTQVGKNRAGATIIGVPMRIEADKRILGRSIDAAK